MSATHEISKTIEENDYKISQMVEVEKRHYGILVRDVNLTKCFKYLMYDMGWYQWDFIHEIFADYIDIDIEVQKYVACTLDYEIALHALSYPEQCLFAG